MCHKSWLALLATQYLKVLAGESWGKKEVRTRLRPWPQGKPTISISLLEHKNV